MLHTIRDTAEEIARLAGALLLDYAAGGREALDFKSTDINFATAADKASEHLITDALRDAFPDHHIVGEEGGGYGPPPERAPFHWYVDPLDGTTNYAHGYPVYCVNLSLADRSGAPVLGVTYDPVRDECFSVIRGEGAVLNGRLMAVSTTDSLLRSILVTGFPYDSHTARDNNTAAFAAFTRRTQGVRRDGSAALDLAYVACGRLDGYWERGPQRWDYLAGMLMVHEAGGLVTTYAGDQEGLYSGDAFVASNGRIHAELLAVLAEVGASFSQAAPRQEI